jgi:histidyl-tRNA synthetase
VLDSKRPPDAPIIAGAPTIDTHWSTGAAEHFATVTRGLGSLDIPFTVDHRLVRGLDYYRRTTFEFRGLTLDSAQNALGGGGRYDGLVEDLGGPPTSGVGFAIGVDRTLLACDDEGVFPTPDPSVDVLVVDTVDGTAALAITTELRRSGVATDRAYDGRSMKAQMKAADRSGAAIAVIVGPDEADAGTALIRPMRGDAEQEVVVRTDLLSRLSAMLSPHPTDRTTTTTPG